MTTAEGVEETEQLAALKEIGCVQGQGYLFGRAVPAAEAKQMLESASAASAA